MRKIQLGLWLCGALLAAAGYAAERSFTLEQVLSAPFPEDLIAAAKGSRFAWTFNAEGKRNVWVAEGPRFAPRQLTAYTQDDGQEISNLQFAPDAATLLYVRGGNKNTDGEVPDPTSNPMGSKQEVWAIAWAGGPPRKIDEGHSPVISARGDQVAYEKDDKIWIASLAGTGKPAEIITRGKDGEPVWSPDGKRLAFVSGRGDHALIAVYDPAKQTVGYLAPSVDRDNFPRWSPDSRSLAFTRLPARKQGEPESFFAAPDKPSPWSIRVAADMSGAGPWPAREVWHSSDTLNGSFPSMAGQAILNWASADRLVFASEEDGWQHLYSIPAGGGSPLLLTPGECEFENAALSRDRGTLFFSSNCDDIDRRHLWRVSTAGGTPQQVTAGEGIEWRPTPTADGKWLVYFASDARTPAMPFVRPAAGKISSAGVAATSGGRMLAALPKEFPADQLVVPQQVIFEAADGWKIHGQLFLPATLKAGERRPAIIFMHGGPIREMLLGWHYSYYYSNAYGMNQYLASRGYIVLSVNYRSGIGYSRKFRMAPGRGPRGASEYQDIVAAGRYLQSRADVEPDRIGLWGGSYGGYLTALGLARNSELFAAGVDLHGVHDWSMRQFLGSNLTPEDARRARDSSPVAAIETWRSPVLLIQGDDDRNVNFSQMVDLVARLREHHVEFEQLVFPDEIHDFLLHRSWLKAYAAGAEFFDRKLKGDHMEASSAARR
jgi:dipeptidyl aminopeptidase/acylaminoacyl peptidase